MEISIFFRYLGVLYSGPTVNSVDMSKNVTPQLRSATNDPAKQTQFSSHSICLTSSADQISCQCDQADELTTEQSHNQSCSADHSSLAATENQVNPDNRGGLLPLRSTISCGVRLRRLSRSDLAAFQAYRHDPEVGRWQGWQPQTDAQTLTFIDEMASAPLFVPGSWSQLGISDVSTGQLIGDVGIYISEDGQESEFGFGLARSSQGRGLATAAVREALQLVFAQTAVQCAHAQTDSRNIACIRLMERLGAKKMASITTEFRGEPCIEFRYEIATRPSTGSDN